MLGTRELPYDPLALGGAPLTALRRFDGLAIAITTRSSEILEQLDLLVELDQRHAITVDLLIASFEPGTADLEERLRTAAALSAQGITTRLVLTGLHPGPISEHAASSLRQLFEAARECRAFDVTASFARGAGEEAWSPLLRCLRLETGFPRAVPGRG
jgi:DNA repair photolyase